MKSVSDKITLNLTGDAEVLVKGFIAPIEQMSPNFHKEWEALANLQVAEPEKEYSVSVFRAFLPNKPVSIGDYWKIEKQNVLTLLKQLQPKPNLDMHINIGDSCGLWACLRAYNNQFAHIVFRIHAEFQLQDGWFTPSQFAGDLFIDRVQESIMFFHQYVPEGTLFDVNWRKHKEEPDYFYSTGSGVCPKIELYGGKRNALKETEFVSSITREEAKRKLIKRFYKSQQINWVPFDEALEIAQAEQKSLHVISIDGPLDDEAC